MIKETAFLNLLRRTDSGRHARLLPGVLIALLQAGSAWTSAAAVPSPVPAALPDAPATQPAAVASPTVRALPLAVLHDQAAIWTSPLHLHKRDLIWLAPLAAAAGASLATDHRTMSTVVSHDASLNQASVNTSNGLVYAMIAAPGILFLDGAARGDQHARAAGLLGAEALADGVVVEQGLKLVFWRERPSQDSARGQFFKSSAGIDSSFPSSHAVVAWASAAELAEQYHSPWIQMGLYTAATGVSLTRVLGQEHFPTDVLVGSAAGWLVGRYVGRARHRGH